MPAISHINREIRLKIVYYGPGLGGKTTNLEWIHKHTRADLRGKLISLNTESERTLFFDLLPIELGRFRGYQVRVHLCTVPGQIAFDETRRLVLRHVDGVVFVVDSQAGREHENLASVRNLHENLRRQGDDPARLPLVVQYNKRDLPNAISIPMLRRLLDIPDDAPELEATAIYGAGVFDTMKTITKACLQVVGDPASHPEGRFQSAFPDRRPSALPDRRASNTPELAERKTTRPAAAASERPTMNAPPKRRRSSRPPPADGASELAERASLRAPRVPRDEP